MNTTAGFGAEWVSDHEPYLSTQASGPAKGAGQANASAVQVDVGDGSSAGDRLWNHAMPSGCDVGHAHNAVQQDQVIDLPGH